MGTSWQLNGTDLTTGTVAVVVSQDQDVDHDERVRWQRVPIPHGTEEGHQLGRDHPRVRFRLLFISSDPEDRYAALQSARLTLRDNETVFLTAPDAPANQFYWPRGVKYVGLQVERLRIVHLGGTSAVALDVNAVLREDIQSLVATISGGGDITATARLELEAIAAITGGGDIVAAASKISIGVAAISGGGDIVAAALYIAIAQASITGGGDVVAAAQVLTPLETNTGADLTTNTAATLQARI